MGVRACLFDLDRVLTQTAKVHAAAWKEMFDGFLRERAAKFERFQSAYAAGTTPDQTGWTGAWWPA
jgi:beta-phosphoglucomutase-like phosphatase (HAD superfamily)